MDKFKALQNFWSLFGLKAYDENTVPDNAEMPYITYEAAVSSLGSPLTLSASIWYRSKSWEEISVKALEIEKTIKKNGYITKRIDGGMLYIYAGTNFAQRMNGDIDNVRRIVLTIGVEFLTAN